MLGNTRQWTIYKFTNPNGRVYVGKSCNIKKRLQNYRGLDCKSQHLLYNSFIKYGFSAHTFEVIETFESDISFANGKEIFWIRTNMSHRDTFPEFKGMNLTIGGKGSIGRKMSEELKQKMSKERKGKPMHSEEAKRKISEASKGNQYRKGSKHSEERKRKMSEFHKGNQWVKGRKMPLEEIEMRTAARKLTYEQKPKRPIFQVLKNGQVIKHGSIDEFCKKHNLNKISVEDNLYKQTRNRATDSFLKFNL